MPSPRVSCNRLPFSPRIEIVPPVEECCLGVVFVKRYMLQHVLSMQLCKGGDGGVISIGLANMVEPRPVISPVAQVVELAK